MTATLPTDVAVLWVDRPGSDWLGIYVDGDRVYEGHPPDLDDAFAIVGVPVDHRIFPSDNLRVPGRRGLPLRLPREVVSKEPGQ